MTSKQFRSSTDEVVPSALRGLVASSPALKLIEHDKVVYRAPDDSKVSILSGGGSGHEPTHAGFVGQGMLTAAVAGAVFASPSTKQIQTGLHAIQSKKGTVVVVKNYTGDVLHFGLAAERANAQNKQSKVEMVIVGDDVAVGRAKGGKVGRRGLAGTVLVHKLVGAAAERGYELSKVAQIGRSVVESTVTASASLDHCSVPGRPFETNLQSDEAELGLGIHNEPGIRKLKPIPSLQDVISKDILPMLLDMSDKDRGFVEFKPDDKAVLLINNLGGFSQLELLSAVDHTLDSLAREYNVRPVRVIAGTFTTSMNAPGFSITLFNVSHAEKHANVGVDFIELLDAPAHCTGWTSCYTTKEWTSSGSLGDRTIKTSQEADHGPKSDHVIKYDQAAFGTVLVGGLESVLKEEPRITKYDTIAGDGDCGETLAAGANALKRAIADKSLFSASVDETVLNVANIVEDSMGGTSGGLYAIFLSGLAQGLAHSGAHELNYNVFCKALEHARNVLFQYTKARTGDRTLVDTLEPFIETLSKGFAQAVKAGEQGADSTRRLDAKFGRASYVSKEELHSFDKEGGLPDPGAVGLAALLSGMLSALSTV